MDLFEKLVINHFPFLGVALLSVVIGEAFIFVAFMATFYILCVLLVNLLKVFEKYNQDDVQEWMNHFQGLVVITFFFNFWIWGILKLNIIIIIIVIIAFFKRVWLNQFKHTFLKLKESCLLLFFYLESHRYKTYVVDFIFCTF